MQVLNKINLYINRGMVFTAGIFLLSMIVLTCANIFMREVWEPVRGTFELMGFFGSAAGSFSLGYTQMKRGHIAVDVLIKRFSKKTENILNLINNLVCLLFFSLVAWQVAVKATTLLQTGEVTETLRIVYYPFTYGVALGCAVLSLVFLADIVNIVFKMKGEGTLKGEGT